MEIFFGWILFSIVVGVAAHTRARSGFGWFLLGLVMSPLFAGLLVLALPRGDASNSVFRPDGMLGQTPFRILPNGQVEAMIQGASVRFCNVAEMQLMVDPNATIVSGMVPPQQPIGVNLKPLIIFIIVVACLYAAYL